MTEIVMLDGPDTRAQEVEVFREDFLRLAAQPDLTKPSPVGRLVGGQPLAGTKRHQMIWEIVADAMTDKDDFTHRAMVILCDMAKWHDEAKALLSDMAQHWAEQRSEL